jgi:hypothetical protein
MSRLTVGMRNIIAKLLCFGRTATSLAIIHNHPTIYIADKSGPTHQPIIY